MFNRLYKLTIINAGLSKGRLVVVGDSSKPSLGVDFDVTVNQVDVSSEGRVTISGLTADHINLLGAIRRYNYPKNAEISNTVTLAIGYKDLKTGIVSPYYNILQGTIISAIPGPLPTRSISMEVFRSDLKNIKLGDNEKIIQKATQASGIEMLSWLNKAASALNKKANGVFQIVIKGTFEGWKMPSIALPETYEGFRMIAERYGCSLTETNPIMATTSTAADSGNVIQTRLIVDDEYLKDFDSSSGSIVEVSQNLGMIGIPRSIPQGASVDVIMKNPIMPGSIVRLISKKFKQLSSDPKLYENGGLYTVMSTRFSGSFYGDMWKQTLTLNRGGAILKG